MSVSFNFAVQINSSTKPVLKLALPLINLNTGELYKRATGFDPVLFRSLTNPKIQFGVREGDDGTPELRILARNISDEDLNEAAILVILCILCSTDKISFDSFAFMCCGITNPILKYKSISVGNLKTAGLIETRLITPPDFM